jgi:hypothetical protein
LSRLRGCTTTAALLDRVCQEVARSCGLERVLLSRMQDGRWHPWVVNDDVADEPWVAEWSRLSIPLDEFTLESSLLREHRPALITDTGTAGVHPIIRQGNSHSYVVAPVVPAGRVVGFLHADHRAGGRVCDETDRGVLWRFAEGFGHIFERTALLENLRAERRRVRDQLTIAERLAIGEGTVKTHVKHILAKLGAVNRSQVIAQYLGFRDAWNP